MKILKVFSYNDKGEVSKEEYRLGERASTHPQEFVKDIIYKNGDWNIVFSDNKEWFKSFTGMACEYIESGELNNKTNSANLGISYEKK